MVRRRSRQDRYHGYRPGGDPTLSAEEGPLTGYKQLLSSPLLSYVLNDNTRLVGGKNPVSRLGGDRLEDNRLVGRARRGVRVHPDGDNVTLRDHPFEELLFDHLCDVSTERHGDLLG